MKKAKAVFLDAYTLDPGDNELSILESILDIQFYDRTAPEEVIERAGDTEILIVNKCPVSKAHIDQLSELKLIQVAATGFNNVDTGYAASKGIPVCNISGYSTTSVAQQVFAMLLSYLNRCESYFDETARGKWSAKADFSYWHKPIRELSGKKLGIVGYGDIGQAVSRIALAFGMDVLVSHTRKLQDQPGLTFHDLPRVLSDADILSLHAPLNDQTKELIRSENIALMKPGLILVNTARGGLVRNADLKAALDAGKIQAALLDVLDEEPPPKDHPLLTCKHAYITPHQAWASLESRQRLLKLLKQNLEEFLEGRINNRVN